MKYVSGVIVTLLMAGVAFAGAPSNQPLNDEYFQSILKKYKLTTADLKKDPEYKNLRPYLKEKVQESSYCYRNPEGEVIGNHIHELRDIASTTKLFPFLFTIDTYGTAYQFNTFFYIITTKPKEGMGLTKTYLYIQGAGDPSFNYARLKQVYADKIKPHGKLDGIYFDENFYAYIYAKNEDGVPSSHTNPGTDRTSQTIAAIKTVSGKSPELLPISIEEWISTKTETENLDTSISMEVETSQPISVILKEMNKTSNNYTASVIYDSIPNKTDILMKSGFTEEELENEIRIYNGSGYPTDPGLVTRKDNQASCSVMLKLLDQISGCLEGECSLNQVFPRSCDKGSTLCSRFKNEPALKQNVVAKTGQTSFVISLVGWLDDVHQIPFAFMISTFTISQRFRAKAAIDEMVAAIYNNTNTYPTIIDEPQLTPIEPLPTIIPILDSDQN